MNDPAENYRFIDHLLFRSLKGQSTNSEEEMVSRWRRSAAENEVYYQELARLLALTADAYRSAGARLGEPPDGLDLLAQSGLPARALDRPRFTFPGHAGSRFSSRFRLITAVAAVATLAFFLLRPQPPPPAQALSFGADEFVTGTDDVATVHLRDGTVVRLGPLTRLRISGSLGEREVTLDGQAFFAVAEVGGHPFTVKTRAGDAVVLGTRFEATAKGDELRLVVVEGQVALTTVGNRLDLGAGEMGHVVEGAMSTPVRVRDVHAMLQWMGNFLAFNRTPIAQVASEIERRFGTHIEILGERLDDQTVTASFADRGVEDVLRVVCAVLAARCSIAPDKATIDLTSSADTARRVIQ